MKRESPAFAARLGRIATSIAVVFAAAIGATALSVVGAYLEQMRLLPRHEAAPSLAHTLIAVTTTMSLLAACVAAHMTITARRALRCGEFPPPDTSWSRAPRFSGPPARRRATLVLGLAAVLLGCGIALPLLTARLVDCLT